MPDGCAGKGGQKYYAEFQAWLSKVVNWLILLQAVRATILTVPALPMIRMMKGRWWEVGITVVLLFSLLMGALLFVLTELKLETAEIRPKSPKNSREQEKILLTNTKAHTTYKTRGKTTMTETPEMPTEETPAAEEPRTAYEYTVETEGVAKYYRMGPALVKAIDGVNLKVPRGEYLSIMGPSGSGKTTLFNVIGGLDKPTRGKVYIDEVDISKLDAYELAWLRCRKIGYIFQTFNLIPVLTGKENVTLPMIFAGVPREERERRAEEILTTVGLADRLGHKPGELSGGQQQRVAIARALANNPVIVLADEPTGNLDLHTGLQIISLLDNLNKEKQVTMISATHDLKMLDISDRIVYLRDGRVEREETRHEVVVKYME